MQNMSSSGVGECSVLSGVFGMSRGVPVLLYSGQPEAAV